MKAHLFQSDEPIPSGEDRSALCGRTVSKAQFVSFFDAQIVGEVIVDVLRFCACCYLAQTKKRYTYGILDGESAKHIESEAA
jgi:hypothetical protein